MTDQVNRLAEIEEHFSDCAECEEAHIPTDDAQWLIDELKRLREELAAYKESIQWIRQALTDYETDRMWAYALRRIERLVQKPEIDIAAQRERGA